MSTKPHGATAEPFEQTDSGLEELTKGIEGEEEGTVKAADGSSLPIPPNAPESGISVLAHKIWVGNLDKRLSQQNVLRFIYKYGTPVSFRFYFKAGTDTLEPRGYCFVEYSTREEAEKAKAALDGKIALGKKIVVDWARFDPATKRNPDSVSETWDASTVSETLDGGVSTSAKIVALEAKLRAMQEGPTVSRTHQRTTKKTPSEYRPRQAGQREERRRRGRKIPDSRIITRPHKKLGRTQRPNIRGPLL